MYTVPEGFEEMRQESIKLAFETMNNIMKQEGATAAEKINAARTVDCMSDTIVKTQLQGSQDAVMERATNKLTRQLEKLGGDGDRDY